MAGGKLAELFIDISLRGGGKVELMALRDQIDAADKSLANNATLYRMQTAGKIDNMRELAEAQAKLAKLDTETYKSKYYSDFAAKQAIAQKTTEQADAARKNAAMEAEFKAGKIDNMREAAAYQEKESQLYLKMYKSKEYADYAAKQAGADRIRQQAEESKNYAKLTAEHGKFGAAVINAKQKFAAMLPWPLNQIASSASVPMAAMAAVGAMVHAGKASSPEAASTMDKSTQLVSMAVGDTFAPVTLKVAGIMQSLAWAVRKINDSGIWTYGDDTAIGNGIINIRNHINPLRWFANDTELSLPNSHGRFGSIESGWRDLMAASSTGGPLETQIAQQQLEALNKLIENTNPQNQPRPGNNR